jgi:hypothetical protein
MLRQFCKSKEKKERVAWTLFLLGEYIILKGTLEKGEAVRFLFL